MDDLISRSALLAAYDKAHQGLPGGARKLIENAPDAVVRCKDCKYDPSNAYPPEELPYWYPCKNLTRDQDWFCGYGKHKEEDSPARAIWVEDEYFCRWLCGNCGAEIMFDNQKECRHCGRKILRER